MNYQLFSTLAPPKKGHKFPCIPSFNRPDNKMFFFFFFKSKLSSALLGLMMYPLIKISRNFCTPYCTLTIKYFTPTKKWI